MGWSGVEWGGLEQKGDDVKLVQQRIGSRDHKGKGS